MTTATDFLASLDFLTDAQRDALRGRDFDHPDAIAERLPVYFEGVPYNLSEGKASRLVGAARRAGAATQPAPGALRVEVTSPDRQALIGKALRERPADPARLRELGVGQVVLWDDGTIDAEKTEHMRRTLGGRGSSEPTWLGSRIVGVDDLDAPTWVQPRTGEPLQGAGAEGVDKSTLLPWGRLGEDGIRAGVVGERGGFFRGMTDEAVLLALTPEKGGGLTPLRAKIETRMRATGQTAIDVRADSPVDANETPAAPLRPIRDHNPPASGPMKQEGIRALIDFLVGAFDAEGIRRLVAHQPHDGERAATNLPGGTVPVAQLAFSAVDVLRRWGMINRALRDSIVNERQKRAAEVDRIFADLGVT